MKFRSDFCASSVANRAVVYRREEFSLDTVPSSLSAFTSILIDDISLEVDDQGKLVSIWGLCPHTRWKQIQLTPPTAREGELRALPSSALTQGVAVRLTEVGKHLDILFDNNSGWLKISNLPGPVEAVRVLRNAIIQLNANAEISSLWIRPEPEVNLCE